MCGFSLPVTSFGTLSVEFLRVLQRVLGCGSGLVVLAVPFMLIGICVTVEFGELVQTWKQSKECQSFCAATSQHPSDFQRWDSTFVGLFWKQALGQPATEEHRTISKNLLEQDPLTAQYSAHESGASSCFWTPFGFEKYVV